MPFPTDIIIAKVPGVFLSNRKTHRKSILHQKKDKEGLKHAVKASRGSEPRREEFEIYSGLGGVNSRHESFLRVYCSTGLGGCDVLVMRKSEKTLKTLQQEAHGSLSMNNVLQIGIRLIRILREIHSKGILHLDLKPSNIMVHALGRQDMKLYLIDSRCSRRFINPQSGNHVSNSSPVHFDWTSIFSSERSHQSKFPSRRDDLESLGYVMLHLAKGQLPWGNISRTSLNKALEKIGFAKRNIHLSDLCYGTVGIYEFLDTVKSMSFEEKPNYTALTDEFRYALERISGAKKKQS